jgi:hypothetical protein
VTSVVRRWDDPRWQLAVFVLAHVAIFAALFRGVYSMPFSGTGLYYDYASAIVAGKVPYRDIFVEYPPLALVFFTLPRIAGASFRWYYVWYQVEIIVADLVVLGALYVARERESAAWPELGAYTALLLAVGPIALQQYDLFPAAITLVAVVCFAARRDTAAWIVLTLGALTKVYPALLAPVFLILDDRPFWPRVRHAALAGVATTVVVLSPLLVLAPSSLGQMVAFHSQRGIHLDSVYSSIAFAARSLGLTFVGVAVVYRTWTITGPAADLLIHLATPILALALTSACVVVYRRSRELPATRLRDARVVATSSVLVVFAGLVSSKVLSPQFLIWPLALLPLFVRPRRRLVWALFAVAGVLTYYIYPLHYPDLLAHAPLAIAALAARNLLLVTLTVIVAGSLRIACADARAHARLPDEAGAA